MIFKKKNIISTGSLSSLAWKKFKKNLLGFGSLVFIGIVILIACLGYLITPDSTPYANNQYLELGLKKPGFTVIMLPVKQNRVKTGQAFFKTMISGKIGNVQNIPIRAYTVKNNHIMYIEYGALPGDVSMVKILPLSEIDIPVKKTFWVGTDRFGRDYLSQLMIGTRVSLSVGLISVLISLVIGIFIGAIGGYYRGWVDNFIMWLINVVWSIPTLLLVIAITFALGKGFWQVFIAVGLTMWVEVARVVRGQILSIRESEYVEAARALGFSDFRIIFRHILPNAMAAVIVISAANFASAILMEAGLSFLGLGVQPPVPSWGSMIKENYGYLVLDYAYLAILPGIAIMLMVLAFMLMGNALRDALDVRMSEV
ncbi:MAG: ABC transporter permease [Bacteroidales bacterium]|nr:ABC transporter permease [Bacteroidales bacterium]